MEPDFVQDKLGEWEDRRLGGEWLMGEEKAQAVQEWVEQLAKWFGQYRTGPMQFQFGPVYMELGRGWEEVYGAMGVADKWMIDAAVECFDEADEVSPGEVVYGLLDGIK